MLVLPIWVQILATISLVSREPPGVISEHRAWRTISTVSWDLSRHKTKTKILLPKKSEEAGKDGDVGGWPKCRQEGWYMGGGEDSAVVIVLGSMLISISLLSTCLSIE